MKHVSRGYWPLALFLVRVRVQADESAGPAVRALSCFGHLRARRDRGLERTLPWSRPCRELRDPQEQSRRIGHGTITPGHPPRSKPSSTSRAWCMSKSPRTRRAQSPGAGRRGRAREDPALDPCACGLRRVLEAKIAALRKVPAQPEARRPSPAKRKASTSPSSEMDHLDGHTSGASSPSRTTRPTRRNIRRCHSCNGPVPPYPLQKAWVTDRAAEGWLAREHRAA